MSDAKSVLGEVYNADKATASGKVGDSQVISIIRKAVARRVSNVILLLTHNMAAS